MNGKSKNPTPICGVKNTNTNTNGNRLADNFNTIEPEKTRDFDRAYKTLINKKQTQGDVIADKRNNNKISLLSA